MIHFWVYHKLPITVNSLYSENCWDLELVTSLAIVRNSRILFQSDVCNIFCLEFSRCPKHRVWTSTWIQTWTCPTGGNMGVYVLAVLSFLSSGISVILNLMCGNAVSSSPVVCGFSSFWLTVFGKRRSFSVLQYRSFALSAGRMQVNILNTW